MPSIKLTSDLLEVEFTHKELNTAAQFSDKNLSLMYLQNRRTEIFRQLVSIKFNESGKEDVELRQHAYLVGQLDLLKDLIDTAYNPPSAIPVPEEAGNSQQFTSPE